MNSNQENYGEINRTINQCIMIKLSSSASFHKREDFPVSDLTAFENAPKFLELAC